LTALLAGALLAGVVVVAGIGRFLRVDDALTRADAIVVLGGGRPARIEHAVALFEAGYADRVVLSGGRLYQVGLACSSADLALEDAEALGLPPDATVLAPEAQSTHDEAQNVAALAQAEGWRALIVVTDPPHTRRAARTFRARLPQVQVQISAASDPDYDPARWWSNEHSLLAVINETIKLLYYWLKHGISPLKI
jgi:uncharacterized SAM-binding protein YcdF (DUF218 family)